ncbi:MAG: hypothetical protein A3I77_01255 [Gammaproteobacteria bacterium RIFCSPLOWO2_02_FULL_42_14]|nr:MAG: hypothetical protein A3B71_07440 [Gammaproteobacteria bacterium RIFCSPHIGHO2_02_FULL_42_43]OGT52256.1 MAG: hypothetical protein A3E54_01315 [Gammaproteobacteria bacterium RIFCSPHIGHO2_12_FULL_41_25]OGT61869.1 MAG: hypothetical protein A3I77_01255 [Gammaproteobacteria bacterium RIFCSPLOWO2_02_FULL_42_14]
MHHNRCVIYNDQGASLLCVNALVALLKKEYDVVLVDGDQLKKSEMLQDTQLFVMPGGRSLPFYEALGDRGNQNIIDFVHRGGTYWGICAGAYYACAHTDFALGLPLELRLQGPLNFFQGRAIGPVFLPNEFQYDSDGGKCDVEIIWEDGKKEWVYFQGGCYFSGDFSRDIKILARYEKNLQPAIIACTVEKGLVILSGVHTEMNNASLGRIICGNSSNANSVNPTRTRL